MSIFHVYALLVSILWTVFTQYLQLRSQFKSYKLIIFPGITTIPMNKWIEITRIGHYMKPDLVKFRYPWVPKAICLHACNGKKKLEMGNKSITKNSKLDRAFLHKVKEEKRSMGTLRRNIVSAVRDMWSSSLTAQVLLASLALLSGNSLMAYTTDFRCECLCL